MTFLRVGHRVDAPHVLSPLSATVRSHRPAGARRARLADEECAVVLRVKSLASAAMGQANGHRVPWHFESLGGTCGGGGYSGGAVLGGVLRWRRAGRDHSAAPAHGVMWWHLRPGPRVGPFGGAVLGGIIRWRLRPWPHGWDHLVAPTSRDPPNRATSWCRAGWDLRITGGII